MQGVKVGVHLLSYKLQKEEKALIQIDNQKNDIYFLNLRTERSEVKILPGA